MGYVEPTDEQWKALTQSDTSIPVTMLNLLKFRDQADYTGHPDETPCSGREAYERYFVSAGACVQAAGGRLRYSGRSMPALIGPKDEIWDAVLLVDYPSLQAFLDMVGSKEYRAIVHHRKAAVGDSRLIPIVSAPVTPPNSR